MPISHQELPHAAGDTPPAQHCACLADQLRSSAVGYNGNPDVRTPVMNHLAADGVVFTSAVAGCPVCTPYRACLLTGRYPLSHGLFMNDVRLPESERTFGEIYSAADYDTAYIGKWHLDGPERSAYTPPGPLGLVLGCRHRNARLFSLALLLRYARAAFLEAMIGMPGTSGVRLYPQPRPGVLLPFLQGATAQSL